MVGKALLYLISFRTRLRSWRNGAVLGSKRPRQGLPFLNGPYQILSRVRAFFLHKINFLLQMVSKYSYIELFS